MTAMPLLTRIATAIRGWLRPDSLDDDVSEEMRFHFERQIEANVESGMTPDEARRAARLTVGSVDAIRDASRDGRHGARAHQILRDLAFGIRLLRKAPGFAATAILVVALGIGATTAIFSVVYGVMLRPLPYADPDRLVALWSWPPEATQRTRINVADYRELRQSTRVFEEIGLANGPQNFNLIGAGEPERLVAARLSADIFSALRVAPVIGRQFTADDQRTGNDRVVLLGDALWRRRFDADPTIVGRTINLSGTPYEVVGVMPAAFRFPEREYQLWIPLTFNPRVVNRAVAAYEHLAVARLKPGARMADAQQELDVLAARLAAEHPATNRGVRLEVVGLREESVRAIRPALYVMLAAVSCLLLIACLNLASLLGTRAAARAREFAVRLALGASRGRLIQQAFAEIVPVLALGGIAGVAGARVAVAAFVPIAPAALQRAAVIDVNAAVLTFSLILLLATGLLAGLLPVVHAWRAAAPVTIGARADTGSRGQLRMRSALVIAQLALTLPLLVGASALARSFSAVINVDPGFRADNVLTLHMAIPRAKYTSDEQIAALYSRVVEHVSTLPAVISAAMVNRVPLSGNNLTLNVEFEDGAARTIQWRSATPDYFSTMGIPLRDGRTFSAHDAASAPLVGIIDERLARSLWPGQRAVGRRFRVAFPGQAPANGEVIGVVGNIRHQGLGSQEDRQIYFNYRQFTDGRTALVVRTSSDALAMAPAVVQTIRTIDPEQPVYDVNVMTDVMARSAAPRWFNLAIVATFAISSLVLACVGLYGVIAFGVTERAREFGVRLALGASPSGVARLVVRKGATLAACGMALGLVGAFALTRGMATLLYGITPLDPASYVAAAALLIFVALAASYVPARRAALSDPTQVLRGD